MGEILKGGGRSFSCIGLSVGYSGRRFEDNSRSFGCRGRTFGQNEPPPPLDEFDVINAHRSPRWAGDALECH